MKIIKCIECGKESRIVVQYGGLPYCHDCVKTKLLSERSQSQLQ